MVCLFPDVGHISVLLSEGMARVSGFGSIPRTPTSFLTRAGAVHGDRVAVVEGEVRHTYGELLDRSRGLAGGLRGLGIDHGDRVSVLAPNSSSILEAHLEAHFGVPWSGGVLNALKLIDQAVPDMVAVEGENSPLAPYHMSGTAGRPKGVMNSHRGAYSQALAMASHTGLDARSRYLWTLPMFHSNG